MLDWGTIVADFALQAWSAISVLGWMVQNCVR